MKENYEIQKQSKIKENLRRGATLKETEIIIHREGYERFRVSEYQNFKIIGWKKEGDLPIYVIFDPTDRIADYVGYRDFETDIKLNKFLQRYVEYNSQNKKIIGENKDRQSPSSQTVSTGTLDRIQ